MLAKLHDVSCCTTNLRLDASAFLRCHLSSSLSAGQPRKSPSSCCLSFHRIRCYRRRPLAALDTDHEVINASNSKSRGASTRAGRLAAKGTGAADVGVHSSTAGTPTESTRSAAGDVRVTTGGTKSGKWKRDRSGSQWARSVYRCSSFHCMRYV